MKKIYVLGSGDAFHSMGHAHSSFLLEDSSGYTVLLDSGATSLLRMKQWGMNATRLDLVLITHFHGDHFAGLPFILLDREKNDRHRLLRIAGPAGIQEAVDNLLKGAYPGHEFQINLDFIELKGLPLRIGPIEVEGIPMNHRPESLGYRIRGSEGRSCIFSGDASLDEALLELISGDGVAIIETTVRDIPGPDKTGHITLEGLKETPQITERENVFFTHIGEEIHEEMVRRFGSRVLVDGVVIDVQSETVIKG